MLPNRMIKNGWSPWFFIGAGAMMLFGVAMTWPAWRDIYHLAIVDWQARYVVLVPVIAVWLAWMRRARLMHTSPHGFWVGLLLILAGGACYVSAAQVESTGGYDVGWFEGGWRMLWHLGAVMLTVGCGVTLLGAGVVKRFLPAIAVLIFLVPLPRTLCHMIEMPIQHATAQVTVAVYSWLGIEAQLIGPALAIGPVRLPVEEVCQGLPMVLDLFLVSWAFVFSTPLRGSVRLIILLLSPLSAILCGALGLMATVWVYGQNGSLGQADLLFQAGSWVMLLLAFLLLTVVIRALAWASVPVRHYTLAQDY